ncbi:MAG: putative bifunctional diguanylate cyclase/phosphodiesterase, partial [Rubrivivax sp.]
MGIPTSKAASQQVTLTGIPPDVGYQLLVLATVWDTTHDAVVLTDTANLIVAVNPAFQQITGYTEAEAIGQTPRLLASGRHPEAFFAAMWDALGRHGQWEGEVLNRRKNGSVYPQWLRITVLRDPVTREVSNYLAVFADLSKQKAAQSQAMRLANFDQLTGLPNQVLLRDRVDQAIAQADGAAHKVALLVLDLDHFKAVNDSLGHAGGDNLLRRISVALTEAVGQTETVSRRGGDEFVLLFPRTDMAHVRLMAQRVLATFSDPFEVNGREAMVSASLGVSMYPADGGDYDTLLNRAEAAMYKAKEAGRRCVRFFTEEMNNQAARDRLTLLSDLTRAPQRGELRLFYQPLVNLVTSEVIGAEALVRWDRPGVGLVPPGVFIPLAESTGLICEIGEWVLNEACRQVRVWVDSGLGQIKVAVNVSALQFTQGVLEQQVSAA